MAIFFKIFRIFSSNKAHTDLKQEYSEINQLGNILSTNLSNLRELQKELVEQRMKSQYRRREATGKIGLSKTDFIEEELVNKLRTLVRKCKSRSNIVEKEIKESGPVDYEERDELGRIRKFLLEVESMLLKLEDLEKIPKKEKLVRIEDILRNTTQLSKEFWEIEKYEGRVAKKVAENQVSGLLKEIYESPKRLPDYNSILIFPLTRRQIRKVEREAEKINGCQDSNFKIDWRKWWRDLQKPEMDKGTPLKNTHINVNIKLFGGPTKSIHLLEKVA